MGWLKAIQAAWSMWNGKKFNSGAAITILATAFQQILAKQGVNADQAQMMATYIIQGVGAIIMVVGYVHQWIKANAAKKAAAVGKVTGTADNTVSGGTVIKLLILGLFLFGAVQTQARDTFNQPFAYLSLKTPPPNMAPTDGWWMLKPAPSFSFLGIARGTDGYLIASPFPGAGIGINLERDITINGNWYSSLSISGNALFSAIPGSTNYDFFGSVLLGTEISPIGIIGIGPGFDGRKAYFTMGYEGNFHF